MLRGSRKLILKTDDNFKPGTYEEGAVHAPDAFTGGQICVQVCG